MRRANRSWQKKVNDLTLECGGPELHGVYRARPCGCATCISDLTMGGRLSTSPQHSTCRSASSIDDLFKSPRSSADSEDVCVDDLPPPRTHTSPAQEDMHNAAPPGNHGLSFAVPLARESFYLPRTTVLHDVCCPSFFPACPLSGTMM